MYERRYEGTNERREDFYEGTKVVRKKILCSFFVLFLPTSCTFLVFKTTGRLARSVESFMSMHFPRCADTHFVSDALPDISNIPGRVHVVASCYPQKRCSQTWRWINFCMVSQRHTKFLLRQKLVKAPFIIRVLIIGVYPGSSLKLQWACPWNN